MTPLQLVESIDRVAGTGSLVLDVFNTEGRLAGERQLEHVNTLPQGSDGEVLLVRRSRRGHEPHLVELALFPALLGHDEMAEMDRIEGTAEDTDAT